MATTTTKTTKKKKLVYKQDPDGVFRLKKINDDTSSLKTNEVIDKKAQVDNYLNELIDCSYSLIDVDDQANATQVATPEENFNKITTPAVATTANTTTTTRGKKIKPTTINTSSKNLKLKATSPVPTTSNSPIQPQRIVVVTKTEPSPSASAQPISSPPSPTLVPSPVEIAVKTIKEVPITTEEEEEEGEEEHTIEIEEEEMVRHKPTLQSRLLSHVPGFLVGVISTCIGLRYKQELVYGILGLTVIGIAVGIVTLLGICSCLYLGLIKTDDLKKYMSLYPKSKVIKETVTIKEETPLSEHGEKEKEEDGDEELYHAVEEEVYLPEYTQEPEQVVEHQEYTPVDIHEKEVTEPQYPQKHQNLPLPEEYRPLDGPKPPQPKRTPSTVKVKPYRCEKRDHKVFDVIPVNNSIPLSNNEPRYHLKTKPELIRASTEPSRLNSRKKKSGSSSPTSAKSETTYITPLNHHHHHQQQHQTPTQIGAPPQLFKVKQLPNLPPQAEELPFINEVRLVDGYNDDEDADELAIPSEASAHHYKTGHVDNLRRNHSTMSKHSVLGTRSNYSKFVSNVNGDKEY